MTEQTATQAAPRRGNGRRAHYTDRVLGGLRLIAVHEVDAIQAHVAAVGERVRVARRARDVGETQPRQRVETPGAQRQAESPARERQQRGLGDELPDDPRPAGAEGNAEGAGQVKQRGRSLHLPGHSVELSESEQALVQPLLVSLHAGRFDPPWVRDLERQHGLPEAEVRRLLLKLSKTGEISQLVPDLFYHPAPLAELAAPAKR